LIVSLLNSTVSSCQLRLMTNAVEFRLTNDVVESQQIPELQFQNWLATLQTESNRFHLTLSRVLSPGSSFPASMTLGSPTPAMFRILLDPRDDDVFSTPRRSDHLRSEVTTMPTSPDKCTAPFLTSEEVGAGRAR
jgi:hypothetical protein